MAPEHDKGKPPALDVHGIISQLRLRAPIYRHDHPPIRNVNQVVDEGMTFGQKAADRFATSMGSWYFIIIQSFMLVCWIIINVIGWLHHWDPYPFILLNLTMSFQAAYAAPIIMMSQNRQALKDRIAAEHDFEINIKAEEEVKQILSHLEYQDGLILTVLARMETHLRGHGEDTGSAPD